MSDSESLQNPPCPPCPAREDLERLAAGSGSADVSRHVEGCGPCSQALEDIRSENDLLDELLGAGAAGSPGVPGVPSIPGYELSGEIHRGAQGVVYRAIQTATRRPVAVKTLVHGAFATSRQRHRFEREVELVATLRHPNVVTIYDSGLTDDGGHYLAMELIEGRPLDEDLAARPELSRRARLELFARICAAVHAAHQRGIIHRDLKPANILVDEDLQPHVLDFGLARREEPDESARTMAGEFLGTFGYAAPEQVKGDPYAIDVRSDVYALGVILYEMLAGRRPYPLRGSMAEVVQTILSAEPEPLRAVDRAIDDELSTIALKALAKDPERRYQSAGALGEDVELYLAGRPINARRDSQWYVIRKTLARHRIKASVAGAFLVLLVAFSVTMVVLYRQALTVQSERSRARSTLAAVRSLLGTEGLQRRTAGDTLPGIIADAERIVGDQLDGQPEIALELRRVLGRLRLERGEYEAALEQFDAARAIQERLTPEDRAALARAVHDCARPLWWLGRYAEAEALYRQALEVRVALYGLEHAEVAATLHHLAATVRQRGRYADAESHERQVLAIRRRLLGGRHPEVAAALNSLGVFVRDQRRFDEALGFFEESLAIIRASGADADDLRLAHGQHNAALCLIELGRLEEAQERIEEALRVKRQWYEDHHTSLALTLVVQADVLHRMGGPEEAEALCRGALAVQRRGLDGDHPDIAATEALLARMLVAGGRAGEAEELLRHALAVRGARLPADDWNVAELRSDLGFCLAEQGRVAEARTMLAGSAADLAEALGDEDPLAVLARQRLAEVERAP